MKQYLDLLEEILSAKVRGDRTGTGTRSVFGRMMRFDLQEGFPLVTTKKMYWKGIVHELLWFISGNTNIQYLRDNNVQIWNEWASEDGELGPVYGSQWRSWPCQNNKHIDQLSDVIHQLRTNPDSRRHIVSAWNVGDLPYMALLPCHLLFQFYVDSGKLSCQMYQRSCDMFLGVPFNLASYSLLTSLVAQCIGLEPGEFIWVGGDCHLYLNHLEQVGTQLDRVPRPLPTLLLDPSITDIDDFRYEHIKLEGYDPHPAIKAEVSV